MSSIFRDDFDFVQSAIVPIIGQIRDLTIDARAGFAAVWGSRENGAFTIERGPADDKYDVCVIAPESRVTILATQKLILSRQDLAEWIFQNAEALQDLLQNGKGD
jgi:hypothetical protein